MLAAMKEMGSRILGFILVVAFLWSLGFAHSALLASGLPDWLAWTASVAGLLVALVALGVAWTTARRWWLLRKPGVKEAMQLDEKAFALHTAGKLAEAQPLFEEELAKAEASGAPIVIAGAANNLAALYLDQHRYEDALLLFKRAFALRKKALGPDDQLTLATGERASSMMGTLGRWDEVEAIQRELLPIYREKGRQAAIETLDAIGVACRHQKKYQDAVAAYSEAESMLKKEGDLESETAATVYNDWGFMLADGRWYGAALPYYAKALAIREKGGDQMAVARVLDNQSNAQAALGDHTGAVASADRQMAIVEAAVRAETGRDDDYHLAPLLDVYASKLEAAGRVHDAGVARRRFESIRAAHPAEVGDLMNEVAEQPA